MADADPKSDRAGATETVVTAPPPIVMAETAVKRRAWLRPALMASGPLLLIATAGHADLPRALSSKRRRIRRETSLIRFANA